MDREMFKVARLAMLRSRMKIPVGCAMLDQIGLLAWGHNEYHATMSSGAPYSIHAEVNAMLTAVSVGRPREAYVYRETRTGIIADSKPCKWCASTMKKYGVEIVYFTSREGPHYREMTL